MSIDTSGIKDKVTPSSIVISIQSKHPLLKLSNRLSWGELSEIVLPDLKATTSKGKWWLGRPLRLRIHLGVYLIQQLYNLTDRRVEYAIKDNAAFQLFCGRNIVKKWHCPDHTKIEEFRSRLSAETQQNLANKVAQMASKLGFCDPRHVDIDSTVQEANMHYPTDSNLLCKLGVIAKRVADYMNEKVHSFSFKPMEVDLKLIKSYARKCFFMRKSASKEDKNTALSKLLTCVTQEIRLVIDNARCMGKKFMDDMPWNIRRLCEPLIHKSKKYLSDVASFIKNGAMVNDKALSFHLEEVRCITKNKPGKKYQFGRVFQLGRMKGNFLYVGKNTIPNQSDKQSIELMLKTHNEIFNTGIIESIATDKGYYSASNDKILERYGVVENGIQRPDNITNRPSTLPKYRSDALSDRRSGIEPLIGHAKHGGQLGRSRMRSDKTIEASGYASVLGFNLRQMARYAMGKTSLEAT